MHDVRDLAKRVADLADEVSRHHALREGLNSFLASLKSLAVNEAFRKRKEFLRGRSEQDWLSFYNSQISQQLSEMAKANDEIISALGGNVPPASRLVQSSVSVPSNEGLVPMPFKESLVSADEKPGKYQSVKVDHEYLRSLRSSDRSKKKLVLADYSVYKSSPFGNFANSLFENYSIRISKAYPKFYSTLSHNLRAGDIKILSKTYISIVIVSSLAFLMLAFFVSFLLLPFSIILKVAGAFFISIFSAAAAAAFFYFYPSIVANSRKRHIKDDLPFVILHMAAVAGSGAQPISMFNLILGSGEYKGLEGEIKKIVNYVNLFGYNLTTALRAVSFTTPSNDFKDLLNGLITTIESGGDLKAFLNAKADETMTNYKLDRKRYVETLSTYSDVYTGILIAAPLLFFITLAIIRMFGTELMSVSISTIASIGTYGLIPLLNVGFILFLNFVQPSST